MPNAVQTWYHGYQVIGAILATYGVHNNLRTFVIAPGLCAENVTGTVSWSGTAYSNYIGPC